MNAARTNLAQVLPVEASSPAPTQARPRRRRRLQESRRAAVTIGAVVVASVAAVTYVFGCASVTRHSYELGKLRRELRQLQADRKHLEAVVADLERPARILFMARQLGMRPAENFRYVALHPQPPERVIHQASAIP